MICPKCNSTNVSRERRPNGNDYCQDCGHLWPSKDSPKDSIVEATSKAPLFEFEGFIIRPFDGWNLWMENPSGEGTQIRKAEFLVMLIKLFKENF